MLCIGTEITLREFCLLFTVFVSEEGCHSMLCIGTEITLRDFCLLFTVFV